MIKVYNKKPKDEKPIVLEDFVPNSWVYVEKPTEEEVKLLVKEFGLEESLLIDACDEHEVPRIEIENGITYIFSRFVYTKGDRVETAPILITSTKKTLITVSPQAFPAMLQFLSGKISFSTANRFKLMLQIFAQINSTYRGHINSITKKLRSLTVKVAKIKNRDIIGFVEYEDILYDFNTSLVRVEAIYNSLLGGKIVKLDEEQHDLLEDLALENIQHIQITKESLRNIVNIREAYSTIMNNNLNRIIKFFTAVTIILTIPTVIGSFFGMNVQLPFAASPFAFTGILLVTLLISFILLLLFIYEDWI